MSKFLQSVRGKPRMTAASSSTIYDQTYTVPGGGLSSGSNITLPSSQTYTDVELEVYYNGQRLIPSIDYNYVGSTPRTQIQILFDVASGANIRFRIY